MNEKSADELLMFASDDEAITYGKSQGASKYQYINCKIGDEDVILCQTNLVYEDEVWHNCYESIRYMLGLLPEPPEEYDGVIEASDIRDYVLEIFQRNYNVRILEVFQEC